jgi:hypothetical protein
MADIHRSPKLAALKSLEASLETHHRSEAARAAALSAVPPEHEGLGRAPWRLRIRPLWVYWHNRALRRCVYGLGIMATVVGLAFGILWLRLASGPISLDLATPWLTAAIEENLGSRYKVEVGGTVLERDENGRTALRIRDVVLRDADGGVVASAPRAEVGFSGSTLFTGRPRAESLNLVGAELSVRIRPDSSVTVFAAADSRPLATSPALASADPTVPAASDAKVSQAAPPSAAMDHLGALLTWLDSLGGTGLDGRDLTEIGLKSGNLLVEDQRNGRTSKFERINLSATRPRAGELLLTLGSENPERPWTLLAGIKPTAQGRRAVNIEARRVSARDLMLAMRLEGPVETDLAISASLRAEIAPDGTPEMAVGRVMAGPGTIKDIANPESVVAIDRAEFTLEWDVQQRRFTAPFQIVSGGTRITLAAHGEAPREPGGVWQVGLSGGSIVIAPVAPAEDALLLNRIVLRGSFDPAKRRLDIRGDVNGKDIGVAGSGSFDFSTPDPRIVAGLAGRNLNASSFKQMWPVFVNTPVREWVVERLLGGSMDRLEIAINAPLSTLRNGGPPLPDDGLSIRVDSKNTVLYPLDALPPIRDADMSMQIAGRNVVISLGKGVVDLPSGRRMTVANGVFEIPDTQVKNPPARVRMRIEGPVPAAAELLAMDRLSEMSGSPLDPATSRGAVTAQITLGLTVDPDAPKGSTNYTVTADVANFAVDKFMLSQRIEAPIFKVIANNQGYVAKGDVKIGGMPANVEYRKNRDDAEAEVRLQAVFDDGARQRFGFDLKGGVTGPVPIRLGARLPSDADADNRFAIEADLTQAKIDQLLPGWIKPPGKAAKANFTMTTRPGKPIKIDDLSIDGGATMVKGNIDLDPNGDLVTANFPVFALSDGDKTTLKAERSSDGVLKVTMRGDVYDGRTFVKSALGGSGSAKDRGRNDAVADLDIDLKLAVVAGHNGEALRNLDLKLTRRGGHIRAFSLSARHGVDAPLIGDLRGKPGQRQVLYFESNDAGALFRFTDTFPRMFGGQMWVAMDPPTTEQTPQEGLLNIRDFTIRGEPALDRIAAGAPGTASNGVDFSRMRVEFTRAPGKLTIKDGVVRGMQVGATMDGVVDYASNDVRLRGTFVPLYGLNNAFGQIPIVGLFLGGGSNEGLVGITFEVAGPPGAPTLRVNPISAVAPGLLRKMFEFPSSVPGERYPDVMR